MPAGRGRARRHVYAGGAGAPAGRDGRGPQDPGARRHVMRPAWLLREGEVLAALEVAETRQERVQGLLGREGVDGAILLRPARSVHSVGMMFTIDVAFCTKDLLVLRTICLRPGRMTRPALRGGVVIEAERGAFERWGLRAGDRLEIRE